MMVVWLCSCCMLCTANGECCDEREHDGNEPLSAADGRRFAIGLPREEHSEQCAASFPHQDECTWGCDHDPFRTFTCAGCGATVAGDAHAAVVLD